MAKTAGKIRGAIGRFFGRSKTGASVSSSSSRPLHQGTFQERLEQRFDVMMDEVEQLSTNNETAEEKMQYGWIALVGMLLPIVFCIGLGYEDGLFMTGFHNFSLDPIILMMYVFGYGLEALRVAMVFSMARSRSEKRFKDYKYQFWFWLSLSLGCGIAQLAAAIVIQAIGADKVSTSDAGFTAGAKTILATLPELVYVAIGVRVILCAIADWACSGYLYKKKETIEQRVAVIQAKATNFQSIIQANINAQQLRDSAQYFTEVVEGERDEIRQLRAQQKQLSDMVFEVGMRKFRTEIEVEGESLPPLIESENKEEE